MPVQLLLAMLRNPASTGAVMPSSRTLANAMAGAAVGADTVVELGAGTGPVTEALLRRLPGVPLIAVELQPALARRLQARFPTVDVRQAAAKDTGATPTRAATTTAHAASAARSARRHARRGAAPTVSGCAPRGCAGRRG